MNFLEKYILEKHSNGWLKNFYKEKFEKYKSLSTPQKDIIEISRDTAQILRDNLIYIRKELAVSPELENLCELRILEGLENDCIRGIAECNSEICKMDSSEKADKKKADEIEASILQETLIWVEEALNDRGIEIHLKNEQPVFISEMQVAR